MGVREELISNWMTFNDLRKANLARAKDWNPSGVPLGIEFAALELCGEVGEFANEIKKALRAKAGIAGGKVDGEAVEDELADVAICVSLMAIALDVDLAEIIERKFNKTSAKHGFNSLREYLSRSENQ